MKAKLLIVALVAGLLGAGSGVPAWADQSAAPAQGRHAHMAQRFQQWLGLTDDQMKQVQTIHQQDRDSWKQLGQSLRQARTELRQLALQSGDPGAVQTKTAEVTQLQAQMTELRVKELQAIAPILTPEQRAKLAQAHMGRHGHGHHGPAGESSPQPRS